MKLVTMRPCQSKKSEKYKPEIWRLGLELSQTDVRAVVRESKITSVVLSILIIRTLIDIFTAVRHTLF